MDNVNEFRGATHRIMRPLAVESLHQPERRWLTPAATARGEFVDRGLSLPPCVYQVPGTYNHDSLIR